MSLACAAIKNAEATCCFQKMLIEIFLSILKDYTCKINIKNYSKSKSLQIKNQIEIKNDKEVLYFNLKIN